MRILLIEDDELLRSGLREAISQAGYELDHLGAVAARRARSPTSSIPSR